MKIVKVYLVVVTVLLVIGLGFGVFAWYTIQKLNAEAGVLPPDMQDTSVIQVTPTGTPDSVEPVTVQTTNLPESKQKVLESFGYSGATTTITPAMVSCAEGVIGKCAWKKS